jgi:hypothetical protein
MNVITARVCSKVVKSVRNRLTLQFGAVVGILQKAEALSEKVNTVSGSIREEVQIHMTEQELADIWDTSKTAAELQEKLRVFLKEKITEEININLVLDLAILLRNVWDILETFKLLVEVAPLEQNVTRFINESAINWNLLVDRAQSWTTLTDTEKQNTRAIVLNEKFRIVSELTEVRVAIARLEGEVRYKRLLMLVNLALLFTGIPAYISTWKHLPVLSQVFVGASLTGYSVVFLIQLKSHVDIQQYIAKLTSNQLQLQQFQELLDSVHNCP